MKVLITGGLGFIGSNFCKYMLSNYPDYELINVDKIGIGANPANLHDIENDKRYTFIKGDICNPQLINRLIHQVDAVVNIAAETHVDRSIADPNIFLQNNTLGTFVILEAIRRHNHKARLLQVSTDEVCARRWRAPLQKTRRLSHPILTLHLKQQLTCLCYRTTKPSA